MSYQLKDVAAAIYHNGVRTRKQLEEMFGRSFTDEEWRQILELLKEYYAGDWNKYSEVVDSFFDECEDEAARLSGD